MTHTLHSSDIGLARHPLPQGINGCHDFNTVSTKLHGEGLVLQHLHQMHRLALYPLGNSTPSGGDGDVSPQTDMSTQTKR